MQNTLMNSRTKSDVFQNKVISSRTKWWVPEQNDEFQNNVIISKTKQTYKKVTVKY